MNIHSPITKESLRLAGFSFVDDTDQCEIDMHNMEWAEHLEKTQESLTLQECLLRTTGGAIDPTKSDWTKLKYKWVDGKAELEEINETDTLIMRNPEGEEGPLKQYPVDKARETLGVWPSNGQEDTQKEKMIRKILKWGNKINKSRLDGEETASASKITIGKTIRYPLAAMTLSKQQASEMDIQFFSWVPAQEKHCTYEYIDYYKCKHFLRDTSLICLRSEKELINDEVILIALLMHP